MKINTYALFVWIGAIHVDVPHGAVQKQTNVNEPKNSSAYRAV